MTQQSKEKIEISRLQANNFIETLNKTQVENEILKQEK